MGRIRSSSFPDTATLTCLLVSAPIPHHFSNRRARTNEIHSFVVKVLSRVIIASFLFLLFSPSCLSPVETGLTLSFQPDTAAPSRVQCRAQVRVSANLVTETGARGRVGVSGWSVSFSCLLDLIVDACLRRQYLIQIDLLGYYA